MLLVLCLMNHDHEGITVITPESSLETDQMNHGLEGTVTKSS